MIALEAIVCHCMETIGEQSFPLKHGIECTRQPIKDSFNYLNKYERRLDDMKTGRQSQ